jgi:Fur family transcriptional regulator, peroxide stress response regulator
MEKVDRFLEKIPIRVTPQRVAVYKALSDSRTHLTAEQIHSKIKKNFPRVSLGTIYSILESFKDKKIIKEIRITFEKSRYETKVSQHHHFLCQTCGKIYDLDIEPCSSLRKKEVQGHLIRDLQGYFYGICKECRIK